MGGQPEPTDGLGLAGPSAPQDPEAGHGPISKGDCQNPAAFDSRGVGKQGLTDRTNRHFHPNRQPTLTPVPAGARLVPGRSCRLQVPRDQAQHRPRTDPQGGKRTVGAIR